MISPAPYSIKQILHSTLLEERTLDLLVDNAERRVSKNPTPSSLEGDKAGSFSLLLWDSDTTTSAASSVSCSIHGTDRGFETEVNVDGCSDASRKDLWTHNCKVSPVKHGVTHQAIHNQESTDGINI